VPDKVLQMPPLVQEPRGRRRRRAGLHGVDKAGDACVAEEREEQRRRERAEERRLDFAAAVRAFAVSLEATGVLPADEENTGLLNLLAA